MGVGSWGDTVCVPYTTTASPLPPWRLLGLLGGWETPSGSSGGAPPGVTSIILLPGSRQTLCKYLLTD